MYSESLANNIFELSFLVFFGMWILGALISGLFSTWLAKEKGYPPTLWFFLGFLFTGFALIAIAGIPSKKDIDTHKRLEELINTVYEALSADTARLVSKIDLMKK